jgi:hypothetical protein
MAVRFEGHKVGDVADLNYDVNTGLQYALFAPANAANNAENYYRFLGEFLWEKSG